MSYRLSIHAVPGVELKRVVAEQAEKALISLTDRPEGLHEGVHEMRKRAKKIRACFRLARLRSARPRELLSRISRTRQRLRVEARTAGVKLMTEKPVALTRRLSACWEAEAAAA
ncbi:MAG TPA: hypothetical protein VMM55_01830 [Thermohalobaculum sp.]|nr:hypothetical protein [Thermohalobaculum sp.]